MNDEQMIKEKLAFLLFYNTVQVTHSFQKANAPHMKVQCKRGTQIIQITNVKTNASFEYDSADEAVQAIQFWLNEA